jgi:hypothetical protein
MTPDPDRTAKDGATQDGAARGDKAPPDHPRPDHPPAAPTPAHPPQDAAPRAAAPNADGLAAAAQAAARKGPPPVHLWNPPFCGDIDMRIARDGTWFYNGTPIGRPALVKLFSGILKREGDRYFLVTPVEKVGITVDDAPFVAVDFDATQTAGGPTLTFTTQVGDSVPLDDDHPLRVDRDPKTGEPAPYIHVRRDLWALIDRKSFYRLVERGEHGTHGGKDWFGIRSSGRFFPVIPMEDLP